MSSQSINNGPYLTHDSRGEEYTPERVASHARDHAAYGWTKRPHNWNPDLMEIYDQAYEDQRNQEKGSK